MNADVFNERCRRLVRAFEGGADSGFGAAKSLVVATGVVSEDEDAGYLKCFALMTWLFGSELQSAALILQGDSLVLVFSASDVAGFKSLASASSEGLPSIVVLDGDKDSSAVSDALKQATGAGPVATLVKEAPSQSGQVAEKVYGEVTKTKDLFNCASGLARVLASKDVDEIAKTRKAAMLSAAVFRYALVDRIERTIDLDKQVSHNTLSAVAENAIKNPAKVKVKGLKGELCDPCYPPIIQSASSESKNRAFDLRPSAESDDEVLHFGCIVGSLGARYAFYCSNITRTLLVNPSKTQEAAYNTVLQAQIAAIEALVPGAKASAAFNAAVTSLKQSSAANKDELVAGIGKNIGFGTGIEYRDGAHVLNAKNDATISEGMVFNVAVGCQGLKDPQNGVYALQIADTVQVRGAGEKPEVFTASARKDFGYISYELGGEDDDEDEVQEVKPDPRKKERSSRSERVDSGATNGNHQDGAVGRGARRRATAAAEGNATAEALAEEERRRKHQIELEKRLLDRGRARLVGSTKGSANGSAASTGTDLSEVEAYKSTDEFPPTRSRQLCVDMEAEALLVPINGVPVPFHISVIKNASKSDEGRHTYLRINFHVPQGAANNKHLARVSANAPKFPELAAHDGMPSAFLKEISFRSSNPQNLSDCLRKIKELIKRSALKEAEAREIDTLVAQEKIRLVKGGRVPFLADTVIRPPLASGKNNRGVLEAHMNGFYYRGKTGHVEIIYRNIRNAYFQEADRETIVCVHFHLKNPIMVGKKKTQDVQFFIEVMDATVRLNEKRRRHFDQDELEEEQRERELKNRTNRMFHKFTKDVEERYDLEFDVPYRQLAFTGAPRSAAVTLIPTVSCIIDIIDWPPFILNLQDVEIAHFERVNVQQVRNFDLVFILKNFQDEPENTTKPTKDMWLRISAIENTDLVSIKKYLDEQEIKYYEGVTSLQWNNVLKMVRSSLEDFYNDGGWQFLSMEGPEEGEDGEGSDEDSLEGDEEFEAPDDADDDDEYGSSDDSSDYSGSDESGDLRAELEGDSEAGEEDLSSGEEGLDWDEQERKARADDAKRADLSDDEDGRRRRPSKSNGSSAGRQSSKTSTGRSRGSGGGSSRHDAASRKRKR